MKELFFAIKERFAQKENVVLVTITESSGSTPRGAGARMLVGIDKDCAALRLWGTIGGGRVEGLVIEEAGNLLRGGGGVFFGSYELYQNEAADLGAVCGGKVSVFSRVLNYAEAPLTEIIEKGSAAFSGEETLWLITEICGAEKYTAPLKKQPQDFFFGLAGRDGVMCHAGNSPEDLEPLLVSRPVCIEENGKLFFSAPLVQSGFVYIFGGGHIAGELVPLLAHLNFRCVVFDDRKEFSQPDLFPLAEKVIRGNFENLKAHIKLTERDYAVIVTRGHAWDLEAWAFALRSPAVYIGIIGSRKKHQFVRERLSERGFNMSEINAPRVHAPIGIDIKSETPQEIAVSIAAELILVRASL